MTHNIEYYCMNTCLVFIVCYLCNTVIHWHFLIIGGEKLKTLLLEYVGKS